MKCSGVEWNEVQIAAGFAVEIEVQTEVQTDMEAEVDIEMASTRIEANGMEWN